MRKWIRWLIVMGLAIGAVAPGAAATHAATTPAATESVAYKLNKTGTDQPSLANSFFTGEATVQRFADHATVTLHLAKYANMIKSFKIGTQEAVLSNVKGGTADLTFTLDQTFAQAKVAATFSLSVINMTQSAELVFAQPLYQAPAGVAYQLNKTGTTQPSLANRFFSGQATLGEADGKPTVTFHLVKYGNLIKSFTIGTQAAVISKVNGGTADLTFNLDQTFAQAKVAATFSPSMLNMTQSAELVFAKPLYQAPVTGKTTPAPVAKPASTTIATPQPSTTTAAVRIYQAQNGVATNQPSAAQGFIASRAALKTRGATTEVTLYTTGASYIQAMRLQGRVGKMENRHGERAALVFVLPTKALAAPLDATFTLNVPGAGAMVQSAFVVLTLPHQAIQAPAVAATPKSALPFAAGGHVLNAGLTSQTVAYTVWDQNQSALSTANQYFTHQARVKKTGSGYDVTLTVATQAGLVVFTPLSVNHDAVQHVQHQTLGEQDVWTFSFHIAAAAVLDQPLPAEISMSVPMAGIANQHFAIWLHFSGTQSGVAAKTATQPRNPAAKGLTAFTIPLAATKATPAPTAAPNARRQSASAAQQALPKLTAYPFAAEIAGFAAAALLLTGAAVWLRRRPGFKKED